MKKTFFMKEGSQTRELTQEEIKDFADHGDSEAKLEILKQDKAKATNDSERLTAIEKFLGV